MVDLVLTTIEIDIDFGLVEYLGVVFLVNRCNLGSKHTLGFNPNHLSKIRFSLAVHGKNLLTLLCEASIEKSKLFITCLGDGLHLKKASCSIE